MRTSWIAAAACVIFGAQTSAASDDKKEEPIPLKPCTIKSPASGSFFDLNPIAVLHHDAEHKAKEDDKPLVSWHARGYDYPANFTLNFCAPVVESLDGVVGVDRAYWRNVSAFYTLNDKIYSIGSQNDDLIFRGKKLVLNYTGGSPCPTASERDKRARLPSTTESMHTAKEADDNERDGMSTQRRKSTVISLLCEHDLTQPKVSVSFVAVSPDECTYFFEARTSAACATVNVETRAVGPGAVFGVIFAIAFLVYLIGGIAYQRAVMHQRGWRQLPNYSIWAGFFGFIKDMLIILTSSCMRLVPGRRGYSRVSSNANGRARSGSQSDAENRLIDQLDEEWED